MKGRLRLTRASATAILGGIAWAAVRYGINVSWDDGFMGLKYEDWNRLEVPALLLLPFATITLYRYRPERARSAPWAMGVTLLGLLGLTVGTWLEFWSQGGWGSEVDSLTPASQLGWAIFFISTLVVTVGLTWFGLLLRQRSWVPTLLGLTFFPAQFFFPPLWVLGWTWVGVALLGAEPEGAGAIRSAS